MGGYVQKHRWKAKSYLAILWNIEICVFHNSTDVTRHMQKYANSCHQFYGMYEI